MEIFLKSAFPHIEGHNVDVDGRFVPRRYSSNMVLLFVSIRSYRKRKIVAYRGGISEELKGTAVRAMTVVRDDGYGY